MLSLSVFALALIAYQLGRTAFVAYFGNVHPIVATAVVILLGAACLRYLSRRGWFAVYAPGAGSKGALLAAGLDRTVCGARNLLASALGTFPKPMVTSILVISVVRNGP